MLFHNLVTDLRDTIAGAVEELFRAALTNQTHPQDLLLVDQHGFFLPDSRAGQGYYLLGPDETGHAYSAFYELMDWYRRSHAMDASDWESRVAHDEDAQKQERLMIQIEQMIYLRFWEADAILKRYHQLSSLATGKPYDWHLVIPSGERKAKNTKKHELIREQIRDRVKQRCPRFYKVVHESYRSQLRNAFAHSQFSMDNRMIRLLNHNPQFHAPLKDLSFADWVQIFHTTLLLYDETAKAFSHCREDYRRRALDCGNKIGIRIVKPDGTELAREVAPRADGRWVFV